MSASSATFMDGGGNGIAKGNGNGKGINESGAHAGGVKKKVTKKRRHIGTSQAANEHEGDTEDIGCNNNHATSTTNGDDNQTNDANPSSPVPAESPSNKSDSDIMIIEYRPPDKSSASQNGTSNEAWSTASSTLPVLNSSQKPAPDHPKTTHISSQGKQVSSTSSSQLSSSQSIQLVSTPPDNQREASTPQQPGSTTPPQPLEVTRAHLEKQIHDAILNSKTIQKQQAPIEQNGSSKPTVPVTTNNKTIGAPTYQSQKPLNSHASCLTPMSQPSASPKPAVNMSSRPESKSPAASQKETPTRKAAKQFYDTRGSPTTTQFSWDTYLELRPAEPAPKEAFRHPQVIPRNLFELGMILMAKDPRNGNSCLAKVVFVEGVHLRLRFVGTDHMNDLFELIDSDNIQAYTVETTLEAPTGYTRDIANYLRYAEKILSDPNTKLAPPEIFPQCPRRPKHNKFVPGMKLEAVDRKNRDFICPATVGEVNGDHIKVMFDGWRGSFDYTCEYWSRDIFPINWCRDVGRPIQAPNGWLAILQKGPVLKSTPIPDLKSSAPVPPASQDRSKSNTAKSSSNSAKPAGKKRGRPPKSTSPSKPASRPQLYSSTPKSKKVPSQAEAPKSKESISISKDHPYSSKIDDDIETKVVEDDEQVVLDPYQCQRTSLTYDQWKQKKLERQMPREESMSDKNKKTGDVPNLSSSMSDTASMASTVPMTMEPKTFNDEVSKKVKKPKMDNSNSSFSDTSTVEKLEHLVATKPKRLSKWSVDDVLDIIKTEDTLSKYVQVFQENEIDGLAFGLFAKQKTELLMQMGLKMGPVLKILDLRERVIRHLDLTGIVK